MHQKIIYVSTYKYSFDLLLLNSKYTYELYTNFGRIEKYTPNWPNCGCQVSNMWSTTSVIWHVYMNIYFWKKFEVHYHFGILCHMKFEIIAEMNKKKTPHGGSTSWNVNERWKRLPCRHTRRSREISTRAAPSPPVGEKIPRRHPVITRLGNFLHTSLI